MNLFEGRLGPRRPPVSICTKTQPYTPGKLGRSRWQHPDARETDVDSENYIEYRCPNCGIVFTTEMPD